jgi:hypothetical protein
LEEFLVESDEDIDPSYEINNEMKSFLNDLWEMKPS